MLYTRRFFREKANLLINRHLTKPKFNSVTGSVTAACYTFFGLYGTLNAENRPSVTA